MRHHSPGNLVVLLEDLAEAAVVHDREVFQEQEILVQLNARRHKALVWVALHDDVRQQQLTPAFLHATMSNVQLRFRMRQSTKKKTMDVHPFEPEGIRCYFR